MKHKTLLYAMTFIPGFIILGHIRQYIHLEEIDGFLLTVLKYTFMLLSPVSGF